MPLGGVEAGDPLNKSNRANGDQVLLVGALGVVLFLTKTAKGKELWKAYGQKSSPEVWEGNGMLLYGDLGRTVSAYLPIHLLPNVCLLVMKTNFFIALRTFQQKLLFQRQCSRTASLTIPAAKYCNSPAGFHKEVYLRYTPEPPRY